MIVVIIIIVNIGISKNSKYCNHLVQSIPLPYQAFNFLKNKMNEGKEGYVSIEAMLEGNAGLE